MSKQIARHLLDIGAVALRPEQPFTWSSGMKSPIYCDNRLTLSFPDIRSDIAAGFKKLIEEKFPEAELIAGTATAGIPHAALVSDLLNLPMCYVRSKAKGHGKGNQIEGVATSGQKAVVIEDLISTGGSALAAASALREAGVEVLGIAAIFTYGLEKGEKNFREAGIPFYTLTEFEELMTAALEIDKLKAEDVEKLHKWKRNPAAEEWMA
ncbi:orotate phosphoribosyltransferase [Bacillus marinisedimentorum]|uniref:orotate phosphoribosyltransferase n=1 Tax=Bacillus marinisedimentorum TaxID=1821260 RepID=UPI0007DF5D32|nr:orotate phosphoribosyltransferase [Bacillus marinisedimentorum]